MSHLIFLLLIIAHNFSELFFHLGCLRIVISLWLTYIFLIKKRQSSTLPISKCSLTRWVLLGVIFQTNISIPFEAWCHLFQNLFSFDLLDLGIIILNNYGPTDTTWVFTCLSLNLLRSVLVCKAIKGSEYTWKSQQMLAILSRLARKINREVHCRLSWLVNCYLSNLSILPTSQVLSKLETEGISFGELTRWCSLNHFYTFCTYK